MRDLRSIFVLLVALLFGLSLALPAEDVPETPYDESEVLPYESKPLFANVLAALISNFEKGRCPKKSDVTVIQTVQLNVVPAVCLTIPDQPLRC